MAAVVADVTVVAAARATSERLCHYLEEAGLRCLTAARPADATGAAHRARAYVLMADDFEAGEVAAALHIWGGRRPPPRVVVVQGTGPALAPEGGAEVVFLPRPAFSWTILDAIVGRATGGSAC